MTNDAVRPVFAPCALDAGARHVRQHLYGAFPGHVLLEVPLAQAQVPET
jgi:hypothetical protein